MNYSLLFQAIANAGESRNKINFRTQLFKKRNPELITDL